LEDTAPVCTHSSNLLAIVQNVTFERGLVDSLARRSTTDEEVSIIIYQMPRSILNVLEEGTGDSLLHRYAREERLSVVDALVDSAPRFGQMNALNSQNETALHIACLVGNVAIAKKIIQSPFFFLYGACDLHENTAFHYACFKASADLCALFGPLLVKYRTHEAFKHLCTPGEDFTPSLDAPLGFFSCGGGCGRLRNALECISRSKLTAEELEADRQRQLSETNTTLSGLWPKLQARCEEYAEDTVEYAAAASASAAEGLNGEKYAELQAASGRELGSLVLNYIVRYSATLQDYFCVTHDLGLDDYLDKLTTQQQNNTSSTTT